MYCTKVNVKTSFFKIKQHRMACIKPRLIEYLQLRLHSGFTVCRIFRISKIKVFLVEWNSHTEVIFLMRIKPTLADGMKSRSSKNNYRSHILKLALNSEMGKKRRNKRTLPSHDQLRKMPTPNSATTDLTASSPKSNQAITSLFTCR